MSKNGSFFNFFGFFSKDSSKKNGNNLGKGSTNVGRPSSNLVNKSTSVIKPSNNLGNKSTSVTKSPNNPTRVINTPENLVKNKSRNNLFGINNYNLKNPPRTNQEIAKRIFSQNAPTNKNKIFIPSSKHTIKTNQQVQKPNNKIKIFDPSDTSRLYAKTINIV